VDLKVAETKVSLASLMRGAVAVAQKSELHVATIFMQSVAPGAEQHKAKNVQLPIYWLTIRNHFIVIALFSRMNLFLSPSAKHLMSLQCIDNFGAHVIIRRREVEASVGQNLTIFTILLFI
jgi:hypothetical protein